MKNIKISKTLLTKGKPYKAFHCCCLELACYRQWWNRGFWDHLWLVKRQLQNLEPTTQGLWTVMKTWSLFRHLSLSWTFRRCFSYLDMQWLCMVCLKGYHQHFFLKVLTAISPCVLLTVSNTFCLLCICLSESKTWGQKSAQFCHIAILIGQERMALLSVPIRVVGKCICQEGFSDGC